MFTAKVQRKEDALAGLDVYVDFYKDGVFDHTENMIPQDKAGFTHWLQSRLSSLNTGDSLKTELTPDLDITEYGKVTPPVLTQAEIDRNTWLEKYYRWVRVKTTVVDTGIVPISNPKIDAMLQDLKSTLLPAYIDFI